MDVFRHHHITDQMKLHLVADPRQFLQKDGTSPNRLQQRQAAITTEGKEVQMPLAIVAPQPCWHHHLKEGNVKPKTQVQTPNLGHPSWLYTFPRLTAVISSRRSPCEQILVRTTRLGHADIRTTQLYLAETESPRAAVEELFSDVRK